MADLFCKVGKIIEGREYRVVFPTFGPFDLGDIIKCVDKRYGDNEKELYVTFADREGFLGMFQGREYEYRVNLWTENSISGIILYSESVYYPGNE